MILEYTKKHNVNILNEELMQLEFLQPLQSNDENEGITPIAFIKSVVDKIKLRVEIDLSESQIEKINNIINEHDGTPLPNPKTELEIMQETIDVLVLDNLGVL